MAAQVSVADYRDRFPQIAEHWTGEAQEVRAAHAEQMASCPDCREFGTICRPCRQRRYEASRPQRSGLRFRIVTSVALGVILLVAGLLLQAKWDADCAAKQPGTRWNGDTWLCEVAR